MYRKILFFLCLCLFLAGCGRQEAQVDLRPTLEALVEEAEGIPKSRENEALVASYRALAERTDISRRELEAAVENLRLLNHELLQETVSFVDGALEKKSRAALGIEGRPLTVGETMSLTELDASWAEGDDQVRVTYDLKYFPCLRTLDLSGNILHDLSGLFYLHELESLDLSGTISSVSDENLEARAVSLEPLRQLSALRRLSLSGNNIQDLSPIPLASGLVSLDLSDNPLTDTSFLAVCADTLTELDLSGTGISDLAPLSVCTRLQKLSLARTSPESLEPLSVLSGLRELDLTRTGLGDLAGLPAFPGLTRLLLGENQIADVAPLSGFTTLEQLDLRDNLLTDLSPLTPLSALRELGLSRNSLAALSVEPFDFLQVLRAEGCGMETLAVGGSVEELYLSGNKLKEFPSVFLPALRILDLSDNRLESATFLEAYPVLTVLDLGGNPVQHLQISLPRLESLDLSDGQFSQIETFSAPALRELDMRSCPLSDLSFLQAFGDLSALAVRVSEADPSPLNALTGLTRLTVQGLGDASLLSAELLAGLEELTFENGTFSAVFLPVLPELKSLSLLNCEGLLELTGLTGLSGLERLTVRNASLSQPAVSGFSSLTYLELSHCGIRSTELLENLPMLNELDLSGNDLQFVRLGDFPALRFLDLSDNHIEATIALSVTMTRGEIHLTGNPIQDFSALTELGVTVIK